MDRCPTRQEIAERAYAIWEQQGRPEGREGEHWAQAEQELTASSPEPASDTISKTVASPKARSRKMSAGAPTGKKVAAKAAAAKTRSRGRSPKTAPPDLH